PAPWPPPPTEGCFGMRGEGVSSFGFRNKNVKQRTWQCNNHLQPFRRSILKGRGFPFQRKLKIQQTSKILLWREKKAQTSDKSQCRDQYPCCRNGDPFQGPNLAGEERLSKQLRKADQSWLEQGEQSLPENQGTPDLALSEGHCSTERLLPEGHCSTRIYSMEHSKAKENVKPKGTEAKTRERRSSKALPTQENASVQDAEPKDSQNGKPNTDLQMECFLRKYWKRIKGKNLG
uniref:Uncharacterized protein n=1 Tax=Bos mutus grunniens TaxID=30521 RepID=A0A8B9Y064_BOSMU